MRSTLSQLIEQVEAAEHNALIGTPRKKKESTPMNDAAAPTKASRKPRPKAPPGETAPERFVRVGSTRVSAAIEALRLVGDLASPSYEFTEDQVNKACAALAEAYDKAEAQLRERLKGPNAKAAPTVFRF